MKIDPIDPIVSAFNFVINGLFTRCDCERDFSIGARIFFKILEDMSPFCVTLIPLFWTSGDVSSGFQSQSGQPYSNLVEGYVLHVP